MGDAVWTLHYTPAPGFGPIAPVTIDWSSEEDLRLGQLAVQEAYGPGEYDGWWSRSTCTGQIMKDGELAVHVDIEIN